MIWSRHDAKFYSLGCTTKQRHIRGILGRTNFFCHAYDTSMTITVTKTGIIIDVVDPTSMTKNHDKKWAFRPRRAGDAAA